MEKELKDYTFEEAFQYCRKHTGEMYFNNNAKDCTEDCPFASLCIYFWKDAPLSWKSTLKIKS